MESAVFSVLAWIIALCAGLMAGTYFAFSGFIMRSFNTMDTAGAIAAMNAINVTIQKSSFMALFFGSTIVGVLMVAAGLWQWGGPGADRSLAAGVIYVAGMFVVTVAANLPLNNALARVSGDGEEASRTWSHYLKRWTRWNTLRTIASVATLIICIELLSI